MANDPHPTKPTAPAAASQPAVPKQYEPPAVWPGNVPPLSHALELLRGTQRPKLLLPSTHKIVNSLTHPERESLRVPGLADALSEALAARWRLAAARDLRATAEGKVDQVALDALMAEVDRVLNTLRSTSAASPELALAMDRTWETLTQEALDFSKSLKEDSDQPAAPPPAVPQRKTVSTPAVTYQPPVVGKEVSRAERRRRLALFSGLALMLATAGAYHARSLLQPPVQETNYPGAPANTLVVPDAATKTLMVRSTREGPASPELLAWLEQLKAQGMQVMELGPGSYFVTPAPKPPPTAGSDTP